MPVYFDKAKGRWRFQFNRVVGGRRARSTKLLPAGWGRAQAEKYAHHETARLYSVVSGLERPEPSIGQAVALYLDHRVPALRNGRKVARDLAFLVEYIDGRPMSGLAEAAREYRGDHPDLSAGTIHNRLAYLKAACRYAWKKHGLTDHDPTGQMEIPRPKNRRDVQLPVARIVQLLNAIDEPASRALYTLAFRTGARWVKGIHARRPQDITRNGRDVWLRIGMTKSGQPRMKWVPPDARWALAHIPFQHRPEYHYERFIAARARVGLEHVWAHDMRHVVATDIIRRGGSLPDVSAALDHLSMASSERYSHIVPGHIKRALGMVGGGRKMHTEPPRARRRRVA